MPQVGCLPDVAQAMASTVAPLLFIPVPVKEIKDVNVTQSTTLIRLICIDRLKLSIFINDSNGAGPLVFGPAAL